MKRKVFLCLTLSCFFVFTAVSSWAADGDSSYAMAREDIKKQYTDFSTKRPWLAIGLDYALFSQTNQNFPTFGGRSSDQVFGNAFNVYAEVFLTRFLSLYLGYQYMNYTWDGKKSSSDYYTQRALQGARIYFGGLFVGGGVYESWFTTRGKSNYTDFSLGGYLDFGYVMPIIKDLLSIETGGRLYFIPDKYRSNSSVPIIANGDDNSHYYSWEWFIGIKVLI